MLTFNQLLSAQNIKPAAVRLLRHQPALSTGPHVSTGAHLIDLWQNDRAAFEEYQSLQDVANRTRFGADYWAAFIGTADGRTVFVGLYRILGRSEAPEDTVAPLVDRLCDSATTDLYQAERVEAFDIYAGRLLIEWGGGASGKRAWIQRADNQNKAIVALLEADYERRFPGLMEFESSLAAMATLPPSWIAKLDDARGVYLLTCPATGAQYTGSASGGGGFWGRWQNYCKTGHGGNVGLMDHDTQPFMATILQVAGSADTSDDILAMEQQWKRKLFSRAFGLNRN